MTFTQSDQGVLTTLSDELAATVRRVGASVVAVHGRRRLPDSGIAWHPHQVVTAAHVLERDSDLHITTPDGAQHAARLLGRDPGSDVAVLDVATAELLPLGNGARPAAGHLVLAVGRPGTPEPIASFGAVSSVGGAWRTAQGGVVDSYLRADMALLPGLSGGALVDMQGRLVGMLSAHLAGGDPVGIPSGSLEGIVQRILSGGRLRRAYLGVSSQPVELQEALRARLGLQQTSGLMLLALEPGAPAERAGLLLGDILLAIGDRRLDDGETLQMALGPGVVGAPTSLSLIRGGALQQVIVT